MYRPDLPIDPFRYAKAMARTWGQLILKIKQDPEAILVFMPALQNTKMGQRLIEYAILVSSI